MTDPRQNQRSCSVRVYVTHGEAMQAGATSRFRSRRASEIITDYHALTAHRTGYTVERSSRRCPNAQLSERTSQRDGDRLRTLLHALLRGMDGSPRYVSRLAPGKLGDFWRVGTS